jgi:hypothetical protein
MKTYARKAPEETARSSAAGVPQQHDRSVPALQFVDNRPEADAQTRVQQIVNHGRRARQLRAVQDMISRGPQARRARRLPAQETRQMVFDTAVQAGVLNVIGEHHLKDAERRQKERGFAETKGLTYLLENEFGVVKNEEVTMGDPTNLRILFAMANIKEKISTLTGGHAREPQRYVEAIRWALRIVEADIVKYAQDNKDNELWEQFQILVTAINRLAPDAANEAILDIVEIVSPGHMLGGSSDISRARSESMHSAATEGKDSRAMWMIGQNHAKDIDDAFPERGYVLLDDKNMDQEMKNRK